VNPIDTLNEPAGEEMLEEEPILTAIEYLEGHDVKVCLRDGTSLQGCLERIGWMSPDSEAISYICIQVDPDSTYVLASQGITTRSGMIFIPWDWVAFVIVP
jgi:hypothetical protein